MGGSLLAAATLALSVAGPAHAAGPAGSAPPVTAPSPEPAAAQLVPLPGDSVGGESGLLAVGGGLLLVAGGAGLWLKRHRAGTLGD